MSENSFCELESHKKISVLLVALFEYFRAGGLSKVEAEQMYNTFMECVLNMEEISHGMLINDIIEKWALPQIKPKGNA